MGGLKRAVAFRKVAKEQWVVLEAASRGLAEGQKFDPDWCRPPAPRPFYPSSGFSCCPSYLGLPTICFPRSRTFISLAAAPSSHLSHLISIIFICILWSPLWLPSSSSPKFEFSELSILRLKDEQTASFLTMDPCIWFPMCKNCFG